MRLYRTWQLLCLALAGLLLGAGALSRAADGAGSPIAKVNPSPAFRPAQGMFLVARRGLLDPNFSRSVVFLLQHGDLGTLGLIVNRASSIPLAEAIPQVAGVRGAAHRLALGGPVERHRVLFVVRSAEAVERAEHVTDDVYVSPDQDLLEELLQHGKTEAELKVFAGHAGWGAGQLDAELARGDWLLVRLDTQVVFVTDGAQLWQTLIDRFDPEGTLVFWPERRSPVL